MPATGNAGAGGTFIGSDASSLGKIRDEEERAGLKAVACQDQDPEVLQSFNMNLHKLVEDVGLSKCGFLVLEERVTLLAAYRHWEGLQRPRLSPIFSSRPGFPPHPFSNRSGFGSSGMESSATFESQRRDFFGRIDGKPERPRKRV